ncbi:MAG: HAD family phosphatase [Isosphaeraceae bacterium]|nr:HAD family phosphatase [Isosphaeraceae bacterium]
MVSAVIFDIDGTLVDSVDLHARAWQEAFRCYGREVSFEEVRNQIGKGGDQILPVFLSPEEIARFGEKLKDDRSELFQSQYLSRVTPFPGTRALFERLRADGKRIALASSARQEELEHLKRIAGIEGLVEEQTSADDIERSKPHPDIFAAALERLGHPDPAEVVVVGDTPYDAEAAGKLGLRTIGVTCSGWPEADLRAAGCVAVYDSPADLLAHYHESPLAAEGQRS